jgi:integration host factor subunit alpha
VNKKNYTKNDIIVDLSKKTGFSLNLSKKIFSDLLNILINKINKNELNLKNFGTFKLINKKERIGRNPNTKKEFIISARKSIRFSCSKNMLNILNMYK